MNDHVVTETLALISVAEKEAEKARAVAKAARDKADKARITHDDAAALLAVDEEREANVHEETARSESKKNKDRLMDLVHAELSKAARRMMAKERPDHTWQPTDVLHEAYVKLEAGHFFSQDPHDRRFFYAAVVRAMTQVLIDHARKRNSRKHGGDKKRVPLDDYLDYLRLETDLDFESFVKLLDSLEENDPDAWLVAATRLFVDYKDDEQLGRNLGLSSKRIRAIWLRALAQLRPALKR